MDTVGDVLAQLAGAVVGDHRHVLDGGHRRSNFPRHGRKYFKDLAEDRSVVELLVGFRLRGDAGGFRHTLGLRRFSFGLTTRLDDCRIGAASGLDHGGFGVAPGGSSRSVRLGSHPVTLSRELALGEFHGGFDFSSLRGPASFFQLGISLLDQPVLIRVCRLTDLGVELPFAQFCPTHSNLLVTDDDLLVLLGRCKGPAASARA